MSATLIWLSPAVRGESVGDAGARFLAEYFGTTATISWLQFGEFTIGHMVTVYKLEGPTNGIWQVYRTAKRAPVLVGGR